MTHSRQRWGLMGASATVVLALGGTVLSGATVARRVDLQCAVAVLDLDASLQKQTVLVPYLATLSDIDVHLDEQVAAIHDTSDVRKKRVVVGHLNEAVLASLGELAPGPSNAQHQEVALQIFYGWDQISVAHALLAEADARRNLANARLDVGLVRILGF